MTASLPSAMTEKHSAKLEPLPSVYLVLSVNKETLGKFRVSVSELLLKRDEYL